MSRPPGPVDDRQAATDHDQDQRQERTLTSSGEVLGNVRPGHRRGDLLTCGANYDVSVPRIFSNLNLNGPTPPRVQPVLGEWGPQQVPTTKSKRRMRIWVGLALLGAMIAIFLLGWYVYYVMTGNLGFGLGGNEQFSRS